MAQALVLAKEQEKAITIATAFGWGTAMGGIQRVSPITTTILAFAGTVGGLIGAMAAPNNVAHNMFEGIAASSAGIFGLGLTAPPIAAGVGAKGATKGPTRALLNAGQAAQSVMTAPGVRVGVGLN